jgi:glycosyltransferase involved in cell wall biosynthesis
MDPATHYAIFGKVLGRQGKPSAQGGKAAPKDPPRSPSAQPVQDPPDIRDFTEDQWRRYGRREAVLSMLARPGLPLVSVVMTAHNSEGSIEAAIESVLMQDYPNLEVVVCDDASTDRTWSILQAMSVRTGGSVRALRLARNSGTYLAKNVAITATQGEFILFQDSDDYSHPMRVACSVEPLLDDAILIGSRTSYARFNPETSRVIRRGGSDAKLGLITLCVRRRAFKQTGYFDMVRRAGDDEWFRRLRHLYGPASVRDLPVSLYDAELRSNSLIADMVMHNPDGSIEQQSSTARRRYVEIFSERFKKKELKRAWYGQSFPPFPARPLQQYPETVAVSDYVPFPVIGGICSIPGRLEVFHDVVNRILPQLDHLHVYLDKYDQVPDFLQSDKITIYRAQDCDVDLRDNAKFIAYDHLKKAHPGGFYYFTFDDDINYPHDYVRHLMCSIDNFGGKAVVGVHGVVKFEIPVKYSSDRFIYHFSLGALDQPKMVNSLGTGTTAFWSGAFDSIDPFAWGRGGAADIDFAILAKCKGVPMVCVQRHQGWLSAHKLPSTDVPLFKENKAREEHLAKKLSETQPWGYQAICATLDQLEPSARAPFEALLPKFPTSVQVAQFAHRLRRDKNDKALR